MCSRGVRVDSTLRAPVLCRLLVAAAKRDTAGLSRVAARLARLDSAPTPPSGGPQTLVETNLPALFRWELARAASALGLGSLLMRLRWMVLAGDELGARTLARGPQAEGDASRLFVPLDPLVAPAVQARRF